MKRSSIRGRAGTDRSWVDDLSPYFASLHPGYENCIAPLIPPCLTPPAFLSPMPPTTHIASGSRGATSARLTPMAKLASRVRLGLSLHRLDRARAGPVRHLYRHRRAVP